MFGDFRNPTEEPAIPLVQRVEGPNFAGCHHQGFLRHVLSHQRVAFPDGQPQGYIMNHPVEIAIKKLIEGDRVAGDGQQHEASFFVAHPPHSPAHLPART